MNWDEKAGDYAAAHHTYEHLSIVENSRHGAGFVRGARWQRRQLRTDDAVERVARALCDNDWSLQGDEEYHWEHFKDNYRASARAAIAALLGEEA